MNSIIKFLFYKTYEDRVSKLKVISFLWFVLMFLAFWYLNSIVATIFYALLFTVPVFSIGLIIQILISDDGSKDVSVNSTVGTGESNKSISNVVSSIDSSNEPVKTIDDEYKKSDSVEKSQKTYFEKDNVGTRQDTVEKANGYWWGTRLQMDVKPPFSLYVFNSPVDAENALLELPFIHKAEDTNNLICDKVLEFGYYKADDEYEAIIAGFDLSLDEFNKVEDAFKSHNGKLKNNLEPSDDVKSAKSVEGNKDNVKFREKFSKNQYTYECYDGKTKADAMEFLKDKEVTEGLYYVCVYTPEGDFGRDINGIYEM